GLVEVDRLLHVGVPHRLGRVDPRLAPAFLQPGDGRAVRAVDLEGQQVVAAHARRPRHVDVRDYASTWLAAIELEGREGRVVAVGLVGLARLVPALRDERRTKARYRLGRTDR